MGPARPRVRFFNRGAAAWPGLAGRTGCPSTDPRVMEYTALQPRLPSQLTARWGSGPFRPNFDRTLGPQPSVGRARDFWADAVGGLGRKACFAALCSGKAAGRSPFYVPRLSQKSDFHP